MAIGNCLPQPVLTVPLLVGLLAAQNLDLPNQKENPLARNHEAVAAGRALYLAETTRCAGCHGHDGRAGGDAPDLYRSNVILRGSDERLFEIVKNGIPGSEMAPQKLTEEQVWQLVSFLQSLVRPGLQPPLPGDPDAGKKVFERTGCAQCHMIGGRGGVLGPDLSSVAARNTVDEIRRSVLEPNARVRDGYKTVTVVTQSGQAITGVLKNEDNFSLQIMMNDGGYGLFLRSDLRDITYGQHSMMPADSQRLSKEQLQDLLAYLDQQRAEMIGSEVWLVKPH